MGNFVIFFAVAIIVFFLIHCYLYWQIAAGLALSGAARTALKIVFFFLAASFFAGEAAARWSDALWAKAFYVIGTTWFGIMGIALTCLGTAHLLRLFRFFSRHGLTVFALAMTASITIFSLWNVSRGPVTKTIQLYSAKVPAANSGFSIIQLSDLHLNLCKSPRWLEKIVQEVNSHKPDIIVITGDLLDADVRKNRRFYAELQNLHSKYGIYAVSGNHEMYSGINAFYATASELHIRILDNTYVFIAGFVKLAGIDWRLGQAVMEDREKLRDKLLLSPQEKSYTVLLSHLPDVFVKSAPQGIDLQLSGHTHAGQIPPMDAIVRIKYTYPYGLYQQKNSYLYTTSGTDVWGPAMRFLSRAEIVKIVLNRAEQ